MFGLIATNTIGQGDTRATGLTTILCRRRRDRRATRRLKWPGEAAVVVSVVHMVKGAVAEPDARWPAGAPHLGLSGRGRSRHFAGRHWPPTQAKRSREQRLDRAGSSLTMPRRERDWHIAWRRCVPQSKNSRRQQTGFCLILAATSQQKSRAYAFTVCYAAQNDLTPDRLKSELPSLHRLIFADGLAHQPVKSALATTNARHVSRYHWSIVGHRCSPSLSHAVPLDDFRPR